MHGLVVSPVRMIIVILLSFVMLMDTFSASSGGGRGGFMFVAADPSFKEEMAPQMCHYDVLEVPRNVDDKALKKAYKKAALYDFNRLNPHQCTSHALICVCEQHNTTQPWRTSIFSLTNFSEIVFSRNQWLQCVHTFVLCF